ncbi:hypothetical protein HUT18_19160 [Streptomyces sp. NA04227]|uniref:hypothetical protein n=1 Tax=Streptomyces sp. NA04227 TaxID=2742136 RepID=UPI001591DAFA|nr:hypothetical protein [Streptomyces sp. NA04227]QKW08182.1 hypothetical protein HUT18_19160 [Streptomyces sp. NA04227]
MISHARPVRLLPWSDSLGRPSYLIPDEGGNGVVSRLADKMEAEQLDAGAEYLAYLRELLCRNGELPTEDLPWLMNGLAESLRNSLRIAHSRGTRLGVPTADDFDDVDDFDGDEEADEGGGTAPGARAGQGRAHE